VSRTDRRHRRARSEQRSGKCRHIHSGFHGNSPLGDYRQ
jgi:hypothetical protein